MRIPILFTVSLALFSSGAYGEPIPLTLLHTNDLHSHLEGFGPSALLNDPVKGHWTKGHYARLSTLIAQVRQESAAIGAPVLLVDAGDFFSGTLFQALTPSQSPSSPELDFFLDQQYDAVAIGNHEFDARRAGFMRIIEKAKARGIGDRLLVSNLVDPSLSGVLPKKTRSFRDTSSTCRSSSRPEI
ncbi:hypothetical protein E3A20_27500 [Planctomyces bekefii]|uniref:Calcineurin-like phosphoesterase domain-containing protein n=1 Tax=Planctomyces bekefii TaxID=1653850 RepID=A0A5C6M259_9PLAN|nr:hypothetical protein E3A20_27500 [Planctomyces bekefii]